MLKLAEALSIPASVDRHFLAYQAELDLNSKLYELGVNDYKFAGISGPDADQSGFLIVTRFEYQEIGDPFVALQPVERCQKIKEWVLGCNVMEEDLRWHSPEDQSFTIVDSQTGLLPREKVGTWIEKRYETMEDWFEDLRRQYPDGIL
ncbi:hypothetical protein OBBRIDRAFT_835899 [Obba rivulosa]|uniref:Uncharacterized protein n=1 Tax=Obba rivulosa TaxID=1052685 RepID=A0A8E2AQZ7_9APHY|nr:hypothetical protein OBBRIDRAFT_835899 [Obba rivulosa]